jgi:hypothetical protein
MIITAICIGCKSRKDIDEAESDRLSKTHSVPMCDDCGMPMVAQSAQHKRSAKTNR